MKHLNVYNFDYQRLLKEFERAMQVKGYSRFEMNVSMAREFVYFSESQGITNMARVKAGDIIAYFEYIRNRPNQRRGGILSNSMLRHHMASVRLFFDYLTDSGEIESSPARLPKFSIGSNSEREILTIEEINEVYRVTRTKRERAILSLAYGCGLRRSEIEDLDVNDIVLSNGVVMIRDGKNHRSRTIPLSESIIRELRDYLIQERPRYILPNLSVRAFIINKAGRRMQGYYLNESIKEMVKRAGIKKDISLHSLRHSIATHLLDKGANIEFVKNFLGHRDINTSHLYAKRRKQKLNLIRQMQ